MASDASDIIMESKSLPEALLTLNGRIETFKVAHNFAKPRRASLAKKAKAGITSVKWPHASPDATSLAQAGFYYHPIPTSLDNVRCFTCAANLDGWEAGDSPMQEHIRHAPMCAWALHLRIEDKFKNRPGGEEEVVEEDLEEEQDPMGEMLLEARTNTYRDVWPHEGKKGWKVQVKKLVEAGWCYDPSGGYEDGVKCFYCSLALDGWEPKDDPSKEHLSRRPDCPFYVLKDKFAARKKQAKAKKGRTSRLSKTSRTSIESVQTAFSEVPSMMSLGDDVPGVDDSIVTTASTAMTITAPKGRKRASSKATGVRKTSKSVKKTAEVIVENSQPAATFSAQDEQPLYPDLTASVISETATKPKAKRGKAKVSQVAEPEVIILEAPVTQQAVPQEVKPKRAKGKKVTTENSVIEPEREKHIDLPMEDSIHVAEVVEVPPAKAPRTKKGTKRTSNGMAKADNSITQLDDAAEPQLEPATKPRKRTKLSQASQSDSSILPAAVPAAKPTKKPPAKAKRAKKAPTPEPEAEKEATLEPEPAPAPLVEEEAENETTEIRIDEAEAQGTPQVSTNAPSPAPSTPTPIRTSDVRRSTQTPARLSSALALTAKSPQMNHISTPGSTQSSDAENKPPSSRPSAVRPPLSALSINHQVNRVPVAVGTPEQSPSKRRPQAIGNLTSSIPWTSADLENVFLLASTSMASPSKHDILTSLNLDTLLASKQKTGLAEIVAKVKANLGTKERGMSVEQWVKFCAERSEEKLRRECEAMVNGFEEEGVRAMRVLEGIEAS